MRIRIRLLSGEHVDTTRHTYEEALAARAAGVPIEVGGPQEHGWVAGTTPEDVSADFTEWPPLRTLYPEGIASIEDGSA